MVEYGVNVNNKFGFLDGDGSDVEDPSALLQQAEVKKDDKTALQKKAEKKAEKLKKEKALAAGKEAEKKAAASAAAAVKPSAGKENARPERGGSRGGFRGGDRGNFRGGDRGGPRGGGDGRPPREGGEFSPRQDGEGRGGFRGGRGGPRGGGGGRPFRGRGGGAPGGEEHHREVTFDENTPKETTGDGAPQGDGAVRDFSGGRGRGGRGRGGGYRGDREPREFNADRPPRDYGDRPPRQDRDREGGGEFGGRGRGVGGGGRGRGARPFDRHSGSDRTGVKAQDAKGGHGKGNWGTEKDEIQAAENAEGEKMEKPEGGEETPASPPPPREKTEEELAQEALEAEIAKQKTLAEYRATLQKEEAKFNVRKAGEGADEKAFGKLVPLQKERIEEQVVDEEIVIVKKEPRNKAINVDFKFTDSHHRGGFEGGRGRGGGGRGGRGEGRGGRGGEERGERGGGGYNQERGEQRGGRGGRGPRGGGGRGGYGEPFRVAEEAFPALGAA